MMAKHANNRRITVVQIKGAFTVMVLLGVTWVFGAFAVGEAKLVFQYVFCISNSLQGFLIFVIRCLSYPDARKAWWHFLRTGSLKRRQGTRPTIASHTNSNSLPYKASQNGHNSVKTTSSDSTISTLIFNNSFSWGRASKSVMKNNKQNSMNERVSDKNGKPQQKTEDIEKLYAKPNKKCQSERVKSCSDSRNRNFQTYINGTVPPPVPLHMNFSDKSELERTLQINDLTSDSDVGMIDDITSDEDNQLNSPVRLPGRENWILRSSLSTLDDSDNNNSTKSQERERDICEVKQSNNVIESCRLEEKQRRKSIASLISANSVSNLRRHTSIIMINKNTGDELRAKSQSSPDILQCNGFAPPPPVFPQCNVSSSHTNIINITLGSNNDI